MAGPVGAVNATQAAPMPQRPSGFCRNRRPQHLLNALRAGGKHDQPVEAKRDS
jgi:hypothetical protein